MPVKKKVERRRESEWCALLTRGRVYAGSFVLRLLSLSCRQDSLERSQGRVSVDYSSVFQVCPFRVMVSSGWSVTGQGAFSHCSWSWHCPPRFAAFLGLELKCNWGLDLLFVSVSLFHLPRNFPSFLLSCLNRLQTTKIDHHTCPLEIRMMFWEFAAKLYNFLYVRLSL